MVEIFKKTTLVFWLKIKVASKNKDSNNFENYYELEGKN